MADNPRLSGENNIITNLRAARNTDLRADDAMAPDDHVVGDHDEVVDLGPLSDHGATETGTIDRRIGSELYIIADQDDATLRDFFVTTVFGVIAESVRSDDNSAVQDHPVTKDTRFAHSDMRVQKTTRTDGRAPADETPGTNDRSGADDGIRFDDRLGLDGGIRCDSGRRIDNRRGMHSGRRSGGRRKELLRDDREGGRRIVDADAGRCGFALEIARHKDGRRLGHLQVGCVARMAEK